MEVTSVPAAPELAVLKLSVSGRLGVTVLGSADTERDPVELVGSWFGTSSSGPLSAVFVDDLTVKAGEW